MKIAILSDIHSNLEALEACLAHANARQVDLFVFLGDLVGYGADPVACLDRIETLAQQGALVVKGNHDEAALAGLCDDMEFAAREAIFWTRAQLGQKQRDFLQNLPLVIKIADTCYVHASANHPERWTYITEPKLAASSMKAAQTKLTFSGHVHDPTLYYSTPQASTEVFYPTPGVPISLSSLRQWLVIVGSVGQPRDGNNAACYAIMDRQQDQLTYFRVSYDHASAAKKILAADLPPQFAWRLEKGH